MFSIKNLRLTLIVSLFGLTALTALTESTVYAKEDMSIQIESTTESVDYLDLSKKFDEIDHGELDRYIDHLAQKETPTQIDEETLVIAVEVALRPVSFMEHSYDFDDLIETINESAYSDQTKEKSVTLIQDAKTEYDQIIQDKRAELDEPDGMENLVPFLSILLFIGFLFLLITGA